MKHKSITVQRMKKYNVNFDTYTHVLNKYWHMLKKHSQVAIQNMSETVWFAYGESIYEEYCWTTHLLWPSIFSSQTLHNFQDIPIIIKSRQSNHLKMGFQSHTFCMNEASWLGAAKGYWFTKFTVNWLFCDW